MEVRVAKTAGFCFGVKRAVDCCYQEANSCGGNPVYTFGPIIHNEEVIRDLEEHGVNVIHSAEELQKISEGTVIIRSHGVPQSVYQMIEARGLKLVDATCPFVKKIHRIVAEKSREGCQIIVIGKGSHPEVEGICGWSCSPVTVIETEEEARAFVLKNRIPEGEKKAAANKSVDQNFGECPTERGRKLCIVSQTTFNSMKFDKLVEILAELRYDSVDVLNTICNATEERQSEARSLAEVADAMIVIGGKHSSNTQKLFEICKEKCDRTFYIQTLADLDIRHLPSMGCLGITAGASTPNNLIEEVSKQCQN